MGNIPDINVLDCTLRDGGYINNWKFSINDFQAILEGLKRVGISYVELGILGKNSDKEFSTKFSDLLEIPRHRKEHIKYTVMGAFPEMLEVNIPYRSQTDIDIIRLAYFKEHYVESLLFGKRLRELGYDVFVQAMATSMYSDYELAAMLEQVNEFCPSAFYMVDSFGTMFPKDIKHMFNIVNNTLDKNIMMGFHAHNNMQMALANSINFIELAQENKRQIIVDATLYGMGRGAGNTCIELLLDYLNREKDGNYDTNTVLKVIHENIVPLQDEFSWGYSDIYYLIAQKRISAAYIWYLDTKGINDFMRIDIITSRIPENKKHTLDKKLIDDIILSL